MLLKGKGMGYISKNLLDDEEIIYLTRRHKIMFAYPVIWLLLSATFFVLKKQTDPIYLYLSALFLAAAFIHFIIKWIQYGSSEFGVTNQRVIVKEGFIKRKTMEVFLKRIESVQVDQSIWGRVLNFGTINVLGTGGASDPLNMIRAPLEFKRQVQQQLAKM